ncbi:MAG: hypothetical protein MUC69_10240 [Gemmatimonadales bacterium]|nr:hypothetical protein [Gemmatimonadales bacterium]
MLVAPASLAAQQEGIVGVLRQVRGAGDTVPAPGTVILHRLSTAAQGPVDTTLAGPDGGFRFRVTADPLALYLVSSPHHGVEYFGAPISFAAGRAIDSAMLFVHDTSSAAPVSVRARYLVVSRIDSTGRRRVLDLVQLHNAGPRTRVARDSSAATWSMPLAEGAGGFALGEGEFSDRAVERRGDSVAILMPLQPGDRQLVLTYDLPGEARVAFPGPPVTDSLVVLLEEEGARVTTRGFALADSQAVDGRSFGRWAGGAAEGRVVLAFQRAGRPDAVLPLVGALALALGLGIVLALRPRAASARAPSATTAPSEEVSRLVEALARLDADYAGRELQLPPEAWASYQARRDELRRALDGALAAAGAAR